MRAVGRDVVRVAPKEGAAAALVSAKRQGQELPHYTAITVPAYGGSPAGGLSR